MTPQNFQRYTDVEFVKSFTPARLPIIFILPEKTSVPFGIQIQNNSIYSITTIACIHSANYTDRVAFA